MYINKLAIVFHRKNFNGDITNYSKRITKYRNRGMDKIIYYRLKKFR